MTDPTPLPPRRRVDDIDPTGRRLDAVEMDRLARDARDILSRSVVQPDARISTRELHGPLSDIVGVPDRTLGGDNDEAYRTKSAPIRTNAVRPAPPVSFEADRLNHLGRMSAEAVSTQYEAAAKAFEDMAPEVKERVAKIAGALLELDADLKAIAEMAAAIREKGKHVEAQIAEASALSMDIRETATEVTRKLKL